MTDDLGEKKIDRQLEIFGDIYLKDYPVKGSISIFWEHMVGTSKDLMLLAW